MSVNYIRTFVLVKCFLCPVTLGINQSQLNCVSLTLLSYLLLPPPLKGGEGGSVYDLSGVFTLRCLPLALVCLSTTRGSLTYIGSYISGAKSTPQTRLENSQVSSRTWAMSWMFGHKGGWTASLRLFPSLFQMKIASIHYPAAVFQAHILWRPEGGQWFRFYERCAGSFLFSASETFPMTKSTLKMTLIIIFLYCFLYCTFMFTLLLRACFARGAVR